jgi:hypothetical protein
MFCCMVGLGMAGCQAQSGSAVIPTYPPLTGAAALEILQHRAAAIHSLTARCAVTLTRGDRQTIQLDGLLVMAPPDRLRLRVWKLDQAVFDLTVLPDGLWIETSKDARSHGPVVPAALNAGQLAHFLSWFEGGFFTEPGLQTAAPENDLLVYRRDMGDGTSVLCDVAPATATPVRFRLIDAKGNTRFSLAMSEYRSISGTVWPARMSALAAGSAGGDNRIDIAFSDVDINSELAPGALVPPANAEKRP